MLGMGATVILAWTARISICTIGSFDVDLIQSDAPTPTTLSPLPIPNWIIRFAGYGLLRNGTYSLMSSCNALSTLQSSLQLISYLVPVRTGTTVGVSELLESQQNCPLSCGFCKVRSTPMVHNTRVRLKLRIRVRFRVRVRVRVRGLGLGLGLGLE